jgi:hypothetical protein
MIDLGLNYADCQFISLLCFLWKGDNCIINQDHLPDCTILNSRNDQSLVKL